MHGRVAPKTAGGKRRLRRNSDSAELVFCVLGQRALHDVGGAESQIERLVLSPELHLIAIVRRAGVERFAAGKGVSRAQSGLRIDFADEADRGTGRVSEGAERRRSGDVDDAEVAVSRKTL